MGTACTLGSGMSIYNIWWVVISKHSTLNSSIGGRFGVIWALKIAKVTTNLKIHYYVQFLSSSPRTHPDQSGRSAYWNRKWNVGFKNCCKNASVPYKNSCFIQGQMPKCNMLYTIENITVAIWNIRKILNGHHIVGPTKVELKYTL